MEQTKLMDAHVQVRRVYNLLGEVMDLSRQLAEAIDRNDQVSMQMILAMREEPIRGILQAREALQQQMNVSSPEDAKRLRELLDGKPAANEQEAGIAKQVAANIRLLKQVQDIEQPLNRKISRDKSPYH